MAHHCAWEKQPAKTDRSNVVDFDCEIYSCTFVFLIRSQIMEFVAAAVMIGECLPPQHKYIAICRGTTCIENIVNSIIIIPTLMECCILSNNCIMCQCRLHPSSI